MENKVICSFPFQKIYNPPGTEYAVCCWGNLFSYSPNEVLPISHFTGKEMSKLRKEMLTGEKTDFLNYFCSKCWKKEEDYGHSPRLDTTVTKEVLDNFDENGNLIKFDSRFIEVLLNIFGNQCNLQCYECLPHNSSSRISSLKLLDQKWSSSGTPFYFPNKEVDLKKVSKNNFNDIINNIVNNANIISKIVVIGGEPILMKSHFDLLDKLIVSGHSKEIQLSYVSNMTMMNLHTMKKYFDNFKHTDIQWSVDSLGERNYWLRYPTNWEATISNVFEVQKYFSKNKRGVIKATITPTILSITSFKDTFNWLFSKDLIYFDDVRANTVAEPHYLQPRHLPEELKQKISADISIISKYRYNELMQKGDEKMFEKAIEYCDALDRSRGTDWRSTFPEIAKYAN
jgi:organic radical activating enzyme